jgi:hypothetical protein
MLPKRAINHFRLLRLSVRSATHRMLCDDPAAGSRNQCDTGMPETCHPGHRRISAGTELFWKTLSQILQWPYHDIVRRPCRMEGKVAEGDARQVTCPLETTRLRFAMQMHAGLTGRSARHPSTSGPTGNASHSGRDHMVRFCVSFMEWASA